MILDSKIPDGPLDQKWSSRKFDLKLVNPANKRKYKVLVVGTGLAGGSAAATMAELGYNVEAFCFQDSPRRAHSIAAQGGINAAKNYQGDGDSVFRLFYDTIKGGDFRAREANVHRLAEVSVNIIDQCVAQGVPFAREYGGYARQPLVRRRPGQRARSTRAVRPVSSCCSACYAVARTARSSPASVTMHNKHRDDRRRRRRRPREGHHHALHLKTGEDRASRQPTRSCSRPVATATCSTCRRTR